MVIIAESYEKPLALQRLQRLLLYESKIHLISYVKQSIITNKDTHNTRLNLINKTYEKARPFYIQHQYKAVRKLDTEKPPWLMVQPKFNTDVLNKMTEEKNTIIRKTECEILINSTANSHIHLFFYNC